MISPSIVNVTKNCFFKYHSVIGENNINENVNEIKIEDKEYFVKAYVDTINNYIKNVLKLNNIIMINKKYKIKFILETL